MPEHTNTEALSEVVHNDDPRNQEEPVFVEGQQEPDIYVNFPCTVLAKTDDKIIIEFSYDGRDDRTGDISIHDLDPKSVDGVQVGVPQHIRVLNAAITECQLGSVG